MSAFAPSRAVRHLPAALALSLVAACATPPSAPPAPPATASTLPGARPVPEAALAVLRERFPALHVISHTAGPLQVNDADDLAVILSPQGERGDYVVVLLSAIGQTEYRIGPVSKVINPGCALCSASVDIVQHSLFVHVIQAQGTDYANVTYQFSYRDNDDKPRLVSVNTYQPSQSDDAIPHSYSNNASLITGKKIDEMEDADDSDQPRHREITSTVPLRPPIAFDAFSFAPDALGPETARLPVSAFDPADALPVRSLRQLQARYPALKLQSRAYGALRAAGTRDVAVVLAPPTAASMPSKAGSKGAPAAKGNTIVAVLLSQPDGSLKLADTASNVTKACPGCDVQLSITRRSLTVMLSSTDVAGTQMRGYQFAYRAPDSGGAPVLRLIGTRTETVSHNAAGDTLRSINSANLLTGDKLDVTADVVQGHTKRAEQKSQVPLRAPILFSSFGFDPQAVAAETKWDFNRAAP